MFFKLQGITYKDDGETIKSGTATLYKSVYDPNATSGHSRQEKVELLGRVVWLDKAPPNASRVGIFFSPSRGLIEYNLDKDLFTAVRPDDPRLKGTGYEKTLTIHTEFGPSYLFFSVLQERTVFLDAIRDSFPEDLFQKLLAHIAHGCLKNHTAIKCGRYLESSSLSYVLTSISTSTLNCDTAFFSAMADDGVKVAFFRSLVKHMRVDHPNFGKSCYVDSTPLPGEAKDNPFNALCSHGTDGLLIQSRLVLLLDIETEIPLWFFLIPSNVLDHSTIMTAKADAEATLEIEIDEFELDAGYARKELFAAYNTSNATYEDAEGVEKERILMLRMPAKPGYPHDELYITSKPRLFDACFTFDYENHTYYGERYERDILGSPEYCYVYLDQDRAKDLSRKWREQNPGAWEALSADDKNWYSVKDGFFILVGNKKETPRTALARYLSRSAIEALFKDTKSYLEILPLAKWYKETIMGKIFCDIIEVILYRSFRYELSPVPMCMSDILVELRSLEATKTDDTMLMISTPKKQVTDIFNAIGYDVPGHVDIGAFRDLILKGKKMDKTPITVAKKKPGPKIKHSPEEKARIAAEKKAARAAEKERKKAERNAARAAEKERKKAERNAARAAEKERQKAEREATRAAEKERQKAEQEATKEAEKGSKKKAEKATANDEQRSAKKG